MIYETFSLNGTWNMAYTEDLYDNTQLPSPEWFPIANAVPGYWEDMQERFQIAPFFRMLKLNPEYGLQRYPIAGTPPDMALPNIVGTFFYTRSFMWDCETDSVALFFGGVQNRVSVWLNGAFLGCHKGYSTPFTIEIPSHCLKSGENTIVLSVSNTVLPGYNGNIVSGITNRAASQYTGGLYGDVELRKYQTPLRDAAVLISPGCSIAEVRLEHTDALECTWEILDGSTVLLTGSCAGNFTFPTEQLMRWSPENPKLYTLRLTSKNATLCRTFGVRHLSVDGFHLTLNSAPYYLRGICEHCYYPLTVNPSQDIRYYRNLIRKLKELGFNFIRFHTVVPNEVYMQAADELGMLVEVESPNNTTLEEWAQIVAFCRRHPSVVMYCCGNELLMDEAYIDHLRQCGAIVHAQTDALFSPQNALQGLEYFFVEPERESLLRDTPLLHDPERFRTVGEFTDVYNSYTLGLTSYCSLQADRDTLDSWSSVYQKPRISHEIGIHGTYTDLSLKSRYAGTRIGNTQMFSSLEDHLRSKGLLQRAPMYFQNSSQWQRRLRKHCFESTRLCSTMAGYDFLGPIDTHWHTFGYDVGMMNEFYELKPGETVENVRRYNSATVLLTDLGTDFNITAGSTLSFDVLISHYGAKVLTDTLCTVRLMQQQQCCASCKAKTGNVTTGTVEKLLHVELPIPASTQPEAYTLSVTLECDVAFVENQWEIYAFPETEQPKADHLLISSGMDADALIKALEDGRDVLLLGTEPFVALPTSFQIALAGRTQGNLATVIADHPALSGFPHDGFCGWQFRQLLENGKAVRFENEDVPFDPIIEVVSTHKFAIRQAALFEFRALNGKLLVCGLNFDPKDPAANWLRAQLIRYAASDAFMPGAYLDAQKLHLLMETTGQNAEQNRNFAANPNDKSAGVPK